MRYRRHWLALAVVVGVSFLVLGREGGRIIAGAPPIPDAVVTRDGEPVLDGASIRRGQEVWQSLGGQQLGSIWGHGAYQAPDWTADFLHRESLALLDAWAKAAGTASYARLPGEAQAALRDRLTHVMRENTYDAAHGTLVIDTLRAAAIRSVSAHYADVFSQGRSAYAIPEGALRDPAKLRDLANFFWWTSWAAVTERPGQRISYTSNWPHEPLVGNLPTPGTLLWSLASVVGLILGIGALVWFYARRSEESAVDVPRNDPLRQLVLTPSQRATFKYFVVVALLIIVQIGVGAITAHFGVEGQGFYGIPLAKYLPYAVTRSWHTQLAIFWIATAWLGTGLFLAPAIGKEPPLQKLGVNLLFSCLLVIVVGTLAGQWLSVQQRLGNDSWYWFGHQGYEYVDLGRFWQIFLFIGLFLWLGLMVRAMLPALRRAEPGRPLLVLFVISTVAIALFYGAGLMYGRGAHLSVVEYYRWWVVHLWVEGFFEVFATVAIAFLFVQLGVLDVARATPAVLMATTIFLGGGVIGTLHHLYFAGAPPSTLALGAIFSALEVVPLTLVGYEIWQHLQIAKLRPWLSRYKWPIHFFVGVAFWNLIGAGVFGFLINPPISLYYVQGLNLTPVHGHTALFGVYGLLGMGLMLFCLRVLDGARVWNERALRLSFWSLNLGLVAMVVLSMLPIGILQAEAAIEHGTWWARSAEFQSTPLMHTLRWLRAPGDLIFALGAGSFVWFVLGLKTGWSIAEPAAAPEHPAELEESTSIAQLS